MKKKASFLIFDIWGDWAHFKKIYTTSSPLSYAFPPRTTICGIVGAIVGLEKSNVSGRKEPYLNYFSEKETQVAIQILRPIKKVRWNLNLINTKKNWYVQDGERTQVRAEFVKSPKYRVYFTTSHQDVYERLKTNLSSHQSYYSVSLGLSELLAEFSYLDEVTAELKSADDSVILNNVAPYHQIKNLQIGKGSMYNRETIASEMNLVREVITRKQYLYKTQWADKNDRGIKASASEYYALSNGDNILVL